jgi:hypothetical protein
MIHPQRNLSTLVKFPNDFKGRIFFMGKPPIPTPTLKIIAQDELFIGHDESFIVNGRGVYGNSVTFAPLVDIGQEI